MFLCDLFEILCPVTVKPKLFLPQVIEPVHDTLDASFKPCLELRVVLVARLHDLLVVLAVHQLDIVRKLIFHFNREWVFGVGLDYWWWVYWVSYKGMNKKSAYT